MDNYLCGLFGWQWAKNKQPDFRTTKVLAHELSKAMDKRGGHAWGVWSKKLIHRGMGGANPHADLYARLESMFGHSRWATHGANTLENTHPFIGQGLSLSHNGVISNHAALNSKFNRKFQVDSQHILAHLAEDKPFTDIEAYGAITWARDADDQCIYMGLLSSSGSFCVVETEAGMVWASTESAVKDACKAAKLEITKEFDLKPGQAYFAEGGKLFIDNTHTSILVTSPPVVQHWGSFTTGAHTTYWCNKHKKTYAKCSCKGFQAWIVNVLSSKLPKEGEEAEAYVPPKSSPPRYVMNRGPTSSSHDYLRGIQQPFCARAACMKRQTVRGILCEEHQLESDEISRGQLGKPVNQTHEQSGRSSYRTGVPPFCTYQHCFEPRKDWDSLLCVYHGGLAGEDKIEPILLTQVAEPPAYAVNPARSGAVQDMLAAWADEHEPSDRAKHQMKCDLAAWWLEDNMGAEGQLGGMTPSDVLALAEEMGFDAETAVKEALAVTSDQKAPNANPEPSATIPSTEAGVQQPKAQHEPSDRGVSGPVGGGPSI